MLGISWVCKPFSDLNVYEIYDILKLRNEVFVVEQNCVFQDVDNKDPYCHHLMGLVDRQLGTYARIVPAGVSYPQASIGRVITKATFRRTGLGKALMNKAIEECDRLFGRQEIKIGAQLYLKHFYQSFGFQQVGEPYLEDGIPHIEMTMPRQLY
jgi:ElaA protein